MEGPGLWGKEGDTGPIRSMEGWGWKLELAFPRKRWAETERIGDEQRGSQGWGRPVWAPSGPPMLVSEGLGHGGEPSRFRVSLDRWRAGCFHMEGLD